MLKRIKSRLAQRGLKSFFGLTRQFSIMDLKVDGTLSLKDFIRALKDYRIEITEQDIHILYLAFSKEE